MKPTVSFTKNAINVFFHILTQCNLKCRHCYINPAQHGRKRLPLGVIESWLKAFVRDAGMANVIFLGGEPTLHPELAEAVRLAKALGYASVTVDTNGYLFNDILENVTPQDLDCVSFSLDGATQSTNDAIRGRGSYHKCLGGIRQAVARGFQTSLIYTVSSQNLHELTAMPAMVRELGISRFFIQVIGLRGKPAQKDCESADSTIQLQVHRDAWMEMIPKVADAASHLGVTTIYPKVFLDEQTPFECAGRVANNFFIFPNGRVYRCPLCEDFPVHSLVFQNNRLIPAPRINENDLFELDIPEGCVMNKIIQPDNLTYTAKGQPAYKIGCCLLKEEIRAKSL